jgi:hypothetical protein
VIATLAVLRIVEIGGPQSLTDRGSKAVADAISVLSWGLVVLVSGCYIWRAGTRVAWKDRMGRVLLIVGYCVIGVAVSAPLRS